MKLFFWKKKEETPVPSITVHQEQEIIKRAVSRATKKADDQLTPSEESQINKAIEAVVDTRKYKMHVIKSWCEEKLTPVAYARVLVRILPVLREYGYSFHEMQHPTLQTRINHDFFLVIKATIREIYAEEYQRQEPA